ncbi:MAG: DUF1287 domain-containing protein [Acidobacteria bacterium]|nr:DUF1287 domain-containing protein [Acidobacteriota bacterium]
MSVLSWACATPVYQAVSEAPRASRKPVPLTPRQQVVANAHEQTKLTTAYDPAYVKLDYPNGDVPRDRGVCADVVVRALRAAQVDLQKEVHEDMARAFARYPQKWGAKGTDANIDHRRVPNLMTWFTRQKKHLPVTTQAADYQPGDVVAWELNAASGQLHIGVVSDVRVPGAAHYAIIHNISAGARLEDVLFAWKIIGHYRYFPSDTEDEPKNETQPQTHIRTRPDRQEIKDRR